MAQHRASTPGNVLIASGPIEASELLRGNVSFELWALDAPERQYLADNGSFSMDADGASWWFVQTSPLGTVTSAVRVKTSKKEAAVMVASFDGIAKDVLSKLTREPPWPWGTRAKDLLGRIDSAMQNPAFKYFVTFASAMRGQCTLDHLSLLDFYYTQPFHQRELQANPKRQIVPRGEIRIQMSEHTLANVLEDANQALKEEI